MAQTNISGASSSYRAVSEIDKNDVVLSLYEGCIERVAGDLVASQSVCVARLLSHMLQSIATVAEDYHLVTEARNNGSITTSAANARRGVPSEQRGSQRPEERMEIRATDTGKPSTHLKNGQAHEMNVRRDDTSLYIHTNGSHAVAGFGSDPETSRAKRDEEGDFAFTIVQGVKIQAQGLEGSRPDGCMQDLIAYAYSIAFAIQDFKYSNSWRYAVCDKVGKELFYGRIVVEIDAFDASFETVESPGCPPASQ
ncbi:uncharacterized protein LTR77_010981 [Saxophila tyrrhenica]|uniref:Uncharacterized protein n=1 Tax=Saxophila tyrrhenica TaxID=1690608 RepID=A0AAV9NXV7_9PEZI|nr:hypothetical protein LTR77_010981 [Saxophila tyrrhenica]